LRVTLSRRLRRHFADLAGFFTSPSHAWLLIRMIGWWAALPVLKRVLPLPKLVQLMRSERTLVARDPDQEARVAALAHWIFKSRPADSRHNCLERALVSYRFLGRAGAAPTLLIGVARPDQRPLGHAWVVVDGRPVHDSPDSVGAFEPILVFGSDATLVRGEKPRG
jgi:hypothetical protein